jgi:hypothetical protein
MPHFVNKIYEVAIICEDEIRILDGIESEGHYWLVPQWIEDTTQQRRKPARVIRLDGLKPLVRQPGDDCDFFVPQPMSKALLYGVAPPEEAQRYVILDSPDLTFALQHAGRMN